MLDEWLSLITIQCQVVRVLHHTFSSSNHPCLCLHGNCTSPGPATFPNAVFHLLSLCTCHRHHSSFLLTHRLCCRICDLVPFYYCLWRAMDYPMHYLSIMDHPWYCLCLHGNCTSPGPCNLSQCGLSPTVVVHPSSSPTRCFLHPFSLLPRYCSQIIAKKSSYSHSFTKTIPFHLGSTSDHTLYITTKLTCTLCSLKYTMHTCYSVAAI